MVRPKISGGDEEGKKGGEGTAGTRVEGRRMRRRDEERGTRDQSRGTCKGRKEEGRRKRVEGLFIFFQVQNRWGSL
jgi:hypothetical protein